MTYSRDEVAARAGSELAYVDRLLELGILTPQADGTFTRGDAHRILMVRVLERAGLPIEAIGEVMRRGELSLDFVDLATYDRFSTLTDTTFAEMSSSTGVPVELLLVIREACGYAEAAPDDRLRENELSIVPLVAEQVDYGFEHAAIERWLRVYGESIRRITDAEVDWWHQQVELPLMARGHTPAEMIALSDGASLGFAPLLDDVLLGLYHGHQQHAWNASTIFGVEAALNAAGVFSRLDSPPTICFLDLTGYTRLTEESGDQAAATTADRLRTLVRRSSAQHGGRPVKWLGDGVMFYFDHASPAIHAALEMIDGAQAAGLPPAHVGLHTGSVLYQEGDYYGRTVNVAARIGDYARPGEVLVSQEVVDATRDPSGLTFSDIGAVDLKGLSDPVHLHSVRRA